MRSETASVTVKQQSGIASAIVTVWVSGSGSGAAICWVSECATVTRPPCPPSRGYTYAQTDSAHGARPEPLRSGPMSPRHLLHHSHHH